MDRHLLDPPAAQPPRSPDLFDRDTVVAARSLLEDDYHPARQEGYISSGDVTRQVEPDVWEAMRAMRATERSGASVPDAHVAQPRGKQQDAEQAGVAGGARIALLAQPEPRGQKARRQEQLDLERDFIH